MEAKMANMTVTSMAFAYENGGCHKRFRPLVPKLSLSSTTPAPVANAVWPHDHQYQQQAFSSTTSARSSSLSAAACLLERKTNRMNEEPDQNKVNNGNRIDRIINININTGDHQYKLKEEVDMNCAQSHPSGTRWNPTAEQIKILEMFYKGGMRTPNAEQIEQITAQLRHYGKIEGKNVFYWFQNHKARERQKQKRNMIAAKARGALTAIPPDSPNEALQTSSPCSNGAYPLYNYVPLPTLTEHAQPVFNSSALLSMPCSKGLAVDFQAPAAIGVLKHEDLNIKGSGSSDSGRAPKNSTWDAIGASRSVSQHGEGMLLNIVAAAAVSHPHHEEPSAMRLNQNFCEVNTVVNPCKRKSRLWQGPSEIIEERCLSLHPESSSESICLQTSDPQANVIKANEHEINPSAAQIIDEEEVIDRQVQTLQLFPLHPEIYPTLKSQGGNLPDDPPHDLSCSLPDYQADQKGQLSLKENPSKLFEFLPKNIL